MAPKRKVVKKSVSKFAKKFPKKALRSKQLKASPVSPEPHELEVSGYRCPSGCCVYFSINTLNAEPLTVTDLTAFATLLPKVMAEKGLPKIKPAPVSECH